MVISRRLLLAYMTAAAVGGGSALFGAPPAYADGLIYQLNDSNGSDADDDNDDEIDVDEGPIDDGTNSDTLDTNTSNNVQTIVFTDPDVIVAQVNQSNSSVQTACQSAYQATEYMSGINWAIVGLGLVFPALEIPAAASFAIDGALALLRSQFYDCSHDPSRTDTNLVTTYRPVSLHLPVLESQLASAFQSATAESIALAAALSIFVTTYERYETLRNSKSYGAQFSAQVAAIQKNAASCAQLCATLTRTIGTIGGLYESASTSQPARPTPQATPLTLQAAAAQLTNSWQTTRGQVKATYQVGPTTMNAMDQSVAKAAKLIVSKRHVIALSPQASAIHTAGKFGTLQKDLNLTARSFSSLSQTILNFPPPAKSSGNNGNNSDGGKSNNSSNKAGVDNQDSDNTKKKPQ